MLGARHLLLAASLATPWACDDGTRPPSQAGDAQPDGPGDIPASDGGDPESPTDRGEDDEAADAVPDAPADGLPDGDEPDAPDAALPVTCLAPPAADPAGTDRLTDALGTATVSIDAREACYRRYTLASTADRRDDLPASPRIVAEQAGWPTLRSGHDLLDALYALALDEVRQNSVLQVSQGTPVSCGDGGCFQAGRLWTWVWTRDTAYAIDLALAALDPVRARNSLVFKLSERRQGGDLQIVQDTGTGGSYPVSTDRVAWALGAWALLLQLEGDVRTAFRDQSLEALSNTLEHDRAVVFDATSGLYFGEQSFLDWREQSYPSWTAEDPGDVAWSRALSTNLLHLRALEVAAALSAETGDESQRDRYAGWADSLRQAIADRFWLEEEGLFATYLPSPFDPAPVRRYDLLGSALAVILGVADGAQADRVLASYPHWGPAAPVIWPQQQLTPIYHNRAEWPFVDAYWLRAAQVADNPLVAERMVAALMRGSALNLSNMESFEVASGAPYLADGNFSGPVINSQRQLWSVAGFLAMVQHTLFGLDPQPDGLRVAPYVTTGLRADLFAGTDEIVLNDYPFRGRRVSVVVHLPPPGETTGSYTVGALTLNGEAVEGTLVPGDGLPEASRIEVWLAPPSNTQAADITTVSDENWRDVFGPGTPVIASLSAVGGRVQLALELGGDAPGDVVLDVYRDGTRVASDLPGSAQTWTDDGSDTAGADSPCYTLEATFIESGNHSQHARAVCWWGASSERIVDVPASEFAATGGTPIDNHGYFHYEAWGDPGDALEVSAFSPAQSGPHLLQVIYGNGSGPIESGITCGVKAIRVEDEAGGAVVAEGFLVMPQLESWSRWEMSTVVPAELEAGHTYHIVIHDDPGAVNMSTFEHFASYYDGTGGTTGGAFNRVNIALLRLLAR